MHKLLTRKNYTTINIKINIEKKKKEFKNRMENRSLEIISSYI